MIADQPLESLVPLQVIRRGDKEEIVCTQWDMGDVEKAGLLKMDFLGLRNLTTLEAAVRHHRASAIPTPRSTSIGFPWTTARRSSCFSAVKPKGSSSSRAPEFATCW